MKLKKTIIYLIIIVIIPLSASLYLSKKYQNFISFKIFIYYVDVRSLPRHEVAINGMDQLYKDILMIEGVSKSNKPKSKILEVNYTRFIFNMAENTKANENKIRELINNKMDSISKFYESFDRRLINLCKKYQYSPDVCQDYFLKSLELAEFQFVKPRFYLNSQADAKDGIKFEKIKKFSKSNAISLGIIISIIIILIIEIFIKRKLIFKNIMNKLN